MGGIGEHYADAAVAGYFTPRRQGAVGPLGAVLARGAAEELHVVWIGEDIVHDATGLPSVWEPGEKPFCVNARLCGGLGTYRIEIIAIWAFF
jgi:hypothetical protein